MSDPDRSWKGLIRAAEEAGHGFSSQPIDFRATDHRKQWRELLDRVTASPAAMLDYIDLFEQHLADQWDAARLGRWVERPLGIRMLWRGHCLVPERDWLLATPPE